MHSLSLLGAKLFDAKETNVIFINNFSNTSAGSFDWAKKPPVQAWDVLFGHIMVPVRLGKKKKEEKSRAGSKKKKVGPGQK